MVSENWGTAWRGEEISVQCLVHGQEACISYSSLSFRGSHLPGPDFQVPTCCLLTVRLVCITGLGFMAFNPLGCIRCGWLPLWDKEAQRDDAPCLRPQSLEHQGQARLEPRSSVSISRALDSTPGTSHLQWLRSHGSTNHIKLYYLCLNSFLEAIKLKEAT